MTIIYVDGDATRPVGDDRKVIAHVSNNQGGWGRGFVLAISKRWKEPEISYRKIAKSGLELGTIQVISVESDITVVNMIAQDGYSRNGSDAINYTALEMCLTQLASLCIGGPMSVHMPKIGTGLGGSSWAKIEPLIQRCLTDAGVPVTIYNF